MRIYAVEYTYDPKLANLMDEFRPAHRAFLRSLNTGGQLLASGPIKDAHHSGALIIMLATDAREALEILADDPFNLAGFLIDRRAREWNPVIGAFARA